ncbi:hypothetical protein [Fluviicola taffensis]|uniref:hypothetical protein n=1 Tax=Fluviicola taffensis TaxID=191579 RepID=UPI0031381947
MNRLLKLQSRVQGFGQPPKADFQINGSGLKQPALPVSVQNASSAYLLVVGQLMRSGQNTLLPRMSVQLEGIFVQGKRLSTKSVVDFAKTDSKGSFVLLVSYPVELKNSLLQAKARIQVAGQDGAFELPILPYEGSGNSEWKKMLREKPVNSVLHRLHLPSEEKLLQSKQLELIAVDTIKIN